MGPSNNESPGLQLPPPVEQAPAGQAELQPGQTAPEQGLAAAPERAPVAPAQPPAAIPLPLPPSLASQSQQGDVSTTTPTANLAARDADLIEKEWVNKAKQIVEQTRDDPYKQSEELTVVKADYLKKRYNKAIKLNK